MRVVRKPDVRYTVDELGDGPRAALLPPKQRTAPVCGVGKVAILDVLEPLAQQLPGAPLGQTELGLLHLGFRHQKVVLFVEFCKKVRKMLVDLRENSTFRKN